MAIVTHPLDQRTDFLGLLDRGDDAALDLGLVVFVLGIAFGEEQRAGQAPQQGALMAGNAAELAAFSSVSHDRVSRVRDG